MNRCVYENAPHAGGRRSDAPSVGRGTGVELSRDQRRLLQEGVADIAAITREFLPEQYVVGGQIQSGADGVEVTVAVQPPAGNPVSAGFQPELDSDEDPIPSGDRREVARGLAASAALQVKQALDGDVPQAAR